LLTNIEKGHPRMVSDLEWLPRHNELSKRGEISKSELAYSQQFVSVSPGGNILFWYIFIYLPDAVYIVSLAP
jgi:hypothetical protein